VWESERVEDDHFRFVKSFADETGERARSTATNLVLFLCRKAPLLNLLPEELPLREHWPTRIPLLRRHARASSDGMQIVY
jgi:hypothetical protein